ncbi:uncharacterized protein PFLUO_LOCUS58 [Penicillium psychrofluorescens]|uniref:uncharacterized protein n=1 Tax=Penicillium psychrofluorescens TaxID=3158075 RepID=UPI003CCD64DA
MPRLSVLLSLSLATIAQPVIASPLHNSLVQSSAHQKDKCGPVSQYYNPTPEKWDAANTDAWLNHWWTIMAQKRTSNSNGFAGAFGEYAIGQPDWSCKDDGNNGNCDVDVCGNPKINSLGNSTQQAFYVLESINQLNGFFEGLDETFDIAAIVAALDNDDIVQNFWWDEGYWNALILKEMFNMIGTLFGVAAAGLGSEVLGVAATLVAGAGGAANIAISPQDSSDITNAELGHTMAQAVSSAKSAFININNALMRGDNYQGTGDIRKYLQKGAWVNYPGLSKDAAKNSMVSMLQSMMINSLWRMQRVFIIGGASCDENQGIGSGPKSNQGENYICDDQNRAWYLYYWQDKPGPFSDKAWGWVARPWGSDRMGKSPLWEQEGNSGPFWKNLDPLDAINSSVKSYEAAGNNYNPHTFASRMGKLFASGSNAFKDGASMEGLWTIPVCDISATVNNYPYAQKEYILQPYGYENRPVWCGPICGGNKNTTAEFYKKANFKGDMKKPFLYSCAENGRTWNWITGHDSG